jgi:diguanylate cyclase (GGDEF)-like protein
MDYGTYFFTNIVSVTVFALSVSLLAWHNRSVIGMRWFAGALVVGWVKLVLQGIEGHAPAVLTGMVANELYLVSFTMQMLGLYWFVVRKPFPHKWVFAAVGAVLAVYTVCFLIRIPYSGNLVNIPFVVLCAGSGWMLLNHANPPFQAVARVTAAVLFADFGVAGYRAILTNLRYMRPWLTVNAHNDPRWFYSLSGMAFLACCMVMCFIWFLVVELERELAEQARTDSLTGALNRRAMEEAALRENSRSIRHGSPLCMIVIDVDHFKQINDSRGHAAGDAVLKALVQQVRSMLRTTDVIARTGGEEFTVLLPDTPAATGLVAAERVRRAIEALEVPFESKPIHFTVSAGVAQFDPGQGGWESMMRRADTAMYEAKERGRNAVLPDAATVLIESSARRSPTLLEPATDSD